MSRPLQPPDSGTWWPEGGIKWREGGPITEALNARVRDVEGMSKEVDPRGGGTPEPARRQPGPG